jgi:hypothetical protein
MHFPDFEAETLSRQAQMVCRDGVYLSERTAGDFFVVLYALHNYYVEVIYQRQTSELLMISAFQDLALLEPYLAKVNLKSVLQPALLSVKTHLPE